MLDIVWQSVIGDQALVRIPALILAIIAALLVKSGNINVVLFSRLLSLVALVALTYSFTFTGHSAVEGLLVRSLLTFHLIAIACWIGSLWPLYKSCTLMPARSLKAVMHLFGQLAIIIVFVLLISGLTLLLQFIDSIYVLFTSNYGQLILLKLLLVTAMLLLGAWHKLFLVPHHIKSLKQSIGVEMSIALLVLITTSVFTTLVGPPI